MPSFPRFPDNQDIVTNLSDVDRSDAFVVFISHCWLRGWYGAEGWDGKAHPDNAAHEKHKLVVEGVQKAWKMLAPGMRTCYIWLDFGCINQDGDPAGELKQLDEIVRACDCIFTPIVDHKWKTWESNLTNIKCWYDDYKAPAWCDGEHAYKNRAWCRMEMLYAANIDLLEEEGNEARRQRFAAGLKSAAERNYRPHLLYGTRESQISVNYSPLFLPPLQNSFVDTHSPSSGSITKETDRIKIEELMAALTIRCVTVAYVGERNAQGKMHGQGKYTYADGNVYEGQWEDGKQL
jgi:hypothetical protein